MTGSRVALLGASGFVGSAVLEALTAQGSEVVIIKAPRLSTTSRAAAEIMREAGNSCLVERIAADLEGVQALVNAAGFPDASSLDEDRLFGANALLPRVALEAATRAGVERFVHVSSAVVQNDKPVLDESEELRPFSPYSWSKVVGEQVTRERIPDGVMVIRYRPPSVHAPGRRVTRMISRIAASPLATVARPGDQPTPQAQLPNVASAVACLATTAAEPPAVVLHPSEGVTVTSLLRELGGGRIPRRLPRWLTVAVVATVRTMGRMHRPTAVNARRLELLWLGQRQAESWLTLIGWVPPVGPEGWIGLASAESQEGKP